MKKLIALTLTLSMLCCCAFAETAPEQEESAFLTFEEIDLFLSSLSAQALADPALTLSTDEEGAYKAAFSGGVLWIADETLEESTAVLGAELSLEQADLRGLHAGDFLTELMEAYPNDNPSLAGSYYDAALYLSGDKPEITAGYVLRDGQRLLSIIHEVFSWTPDGVLLSRVEYALDQGVIAGIRVMKAKDLLTEEEVREELDDLGAMQEIGEYAAYPLYEDGTLAAPFEREDLTLLTRDLTALDFLDLTAESALAAFGPAASDEWTQDSNGDQLRLMQWEGVSLLFQYDEQRAFRQVDSLTLTEDVLDGPRGVRIGDALDGVLFRFRHLDQFVDNNTVSMYGDGQQPPFGIVSYTPENTEVAYALALEGDSQVIWHLSFVSGLLQSMSLLLR